MPKFVTRQREVEAIQHNGNNDDEIKAFCQEHDIACSTHDRSPSHPRRFYVTTSNYVKSFEPTDWLVCDDCHSVDVESDEDFTAKYSAAD